MTKPLRADVWHFALKYEVIQDGLSTMHAWASFAGISDSTDFWVEIDSQGMNVWICPADTIISNDIPLHTRFETNFAPLNKTSQDLVNEGRLQSVMRTSNPAIISHEYCQTDIVDPVWGYFWVKANSIEEGEKK